MDSDKLAATWSENKNCGRSAREEHVLSASTTANTPVNVTLPQFVDEPMKNRNMEDSLKKN